jgi:L-proline amide hydrolase
MTAVQEGRLPFGDYETWYRIVGDIEARPPLICLHGGPGSSHHYFARLEALAERGRGLVVYDQVGCGGSSRPPVEELDVPVFVAELANLRAGLSLDRVFVLGTSWGGMLAQEYAFTQPPGLLGLVLNSTVACAETWTSEVTRLRDEMPADIRNALIAGPEHPGFADAEAYFNARHFCRLGSTPEIERMAHARSPEVYEAVWGPSEWAVTGKLKGWDVRARLREIEVPVLLAAGRYDLCTPAVLEELQNGFPDAPTIIFENSSHTPYLEESDRYMEELVRWIDSIESS